MKTTQTTSRPGTTLGAGLLLAALCLGLLPVSPAAGAEQDGARKVTLHTAVGRQSAKESIPEKLKEYRKSLLRIANDFTLLGTKTETLVPKKEKSFALPKKLGTAKISWNGKTATLKVEKDGKVLAELKTNRFPAYLVDDSLKVKGEQVVLIIDTMKPE
ncbi:MAG: hypothetical protein ACYTGJ_03490 [Planctomycetota bacterium]|jgi:hypothetical protein